LDKKSFESKEPLNLVFELFYLGGPRGTRQKKLQKEDPVKSERGPWVRAFRSAKHSMVGPIEKVLLVRLF
jgi:hypothetical protein